MDPRLLPLLRRTSNRLYVLSATLTGRGYYARSMAAYDAALAIARRIHTTA